jgi:hypothetical protein
MSHRPVVPFVGVLCLLAAASRAPAQLTLLAPVLPSGGDVVKIIDTLTRKDSDTTFNVKLGKTTGQGKLLIARTRVGVALERSSRNWRGRLVVGLTVPSEVSYTIDLTQIKPEHVRPDPDTGRLIVTMPPPQVEDVTPLLSEVKVDNDYRRARFKLLDKDTSRELQNVMLREDYQARARKKAEAELPRIREEGRAPLQQFLQKLLGPSFPDMKVVVE